MTFSCYVTIYFCSDFRNSRFTIDVHIGCVFKTLKGGKVYGKETHKRICYEPKTRRRCGIMCIIAVKPASKEMFKDSVIKQMFLRNRDGAGVMWTENETVHFKM